MSNNQVATISMSLRPMIGVPFGRPLRKRPRPSVGFNRLASRVLVSVTLAWTFVYDTAAQTILNASTIQIDGATYRLWGIDAPDPQQTCAHSWPAGAEAMKRLVGLTQGRIVECEEKGHDSDGRVMALCRADGTNLSAAMVRAGMAWADLTISHAYVLQEAEAVTEYAGVHAHQCKTAWDWRKVNSASSK